MALGSSIMPCVVCNPFHCKSPSSLVPIDLPEVIHKILDNPSFDVFLAGTFSAWTCVLVSAYLRAASPWTTASTRPGRPPFAPRRSTSQAPTSPARRTLHADARAQRQLRAAQEPERVARWRHAARAARRAVLHRRQPLVRRGAKHDYEEMAPDCRSMLFHDIQDTTTLLIQRQGGGGGVPSFWRQLTRSIRPPRASRASRRSTRRRPPSSLASASSRMARAAPRSPTTRRFRVDAWGRGLVAWTSFCALEPTRCRETECRFSALGSGVAHSSMNVPPPCARALSRG